MGPMGIFVCISVDTDHWIGLGHGIQGDSFPDPLTTYPKLLGMAVFALPMIGSHAIVNRYYRRKALRKSEFVPSTETSQARRQN